MGRDPKGYVNGYSFYNSYFIPLYLDAMGMDLSDIKLDVNIGLSFSVEAIIRTYFEYLTGLKLPQPPDVDVVINNLKSIGFSDECKLGSGNRLANTYSDNLISWNSSEISRVEATKNNIWRFTVPMKDSGQWINVSIDITLNGTLAAYIDQNWSIGGGKCCKKNDYYINWGSVKPQGTPDLKFDFQGSGKITINGVVGPPLPQPPAPGR